MFPVDAVADAKASDSNVKSETDGAKPLGPPPRPGQTGNTPDYFGNARGGDNNLSLEPNPFEQSFGGGSGAETPGGTKLPPVAHITSPSALLPGTGTTPFNWGGGSLRTGPLSPAMLSGPTNDYFSDTHHLRGGGFPTPNESSLRTGLTPGGSGSMFPAPSPNSQLFAQIASGGVTPSTLDFHRTAVNAAAAAKREHQNNNNNQNGASVTSQPQEMPNGVASAKPETKPTGPFDPHDNDAANGLFMLARGQGGNGGGPPANYPNAAQGQVQNSTAPAVQPLEGSPPMPNGGGSTGAGSSIRGGSEGSDDIGAARPTTRKGKKNGAPAATNGRRKAEEPPAKGPANKKAKVAAVMPEPESFSDEDDDDDMKGLDGQPKSKMTDEEKRKNFLERNRYVTTPLFFFWLKTNHCSLVGWLPSNVVSVRSSGWPTCSPRWSCTVPRTMPSLPRSHSCGRRS